MRSVVPAREEIGDHTMAHIFIYLVYEQRKQNDAADVKHHAPERKVRKESHRIVNHHRIDDARVERVRIEEQRGKQQEDDDKRQVDQRFEDRLLNKAVVAEQFAQIQHLHRADCQTAHQCHQCGNEHRAAKVVRVAGRGVVVELAQQAAFQQRVHHAEQHPDEPERSDALEVALSLAGEHAGKIQQRANAQKSGGGKFVLRYSAIHDSEMYIWLKDVFLEFTPSDSWKRLIRKRAY